MNIHHRFDESLDLISKFNGLGLSVEEKIKLEIALNKLHSEIKSNELLFFGKISGLEADYYIAQALNFENFYEFPEKSFFYTNSKNFQFVPLPEVNEDYLKDCQKHALDFFIGIPEKDIEKYEEEDEGGAENQGNENNGEDQEKEDKVHDSLESSIEEVQVIEKKKNFKEINRLAYVIRAIDHDTNVFPEGKYKLTVEHEIRPNENFKGLKPEELKNLDKYHHLRHVQDKNYRDLIESDEAIFRFDFFESLNVNKIKGAWSIQLDSTKTISNLRSLVWPGYFAFHKAETDFCGGVYFGNGIKNADLPFMI